MKLIRTCESEEVNNPRSMVYRRLYSSSSELWTADRGLVRTLASLLLPLLLLTAQGCGIYSFTGAAISPEVKTISIQNFYNDSGGGPPVMSQQFTESVKDYYQQNTSLALVDEDGDLQLEGAIVRYDYEPVAPQSSGSDQVADVASEMRLTITVEATYINTYDDQYDFDGKTFSFFADFPADQDPTAVEDDLVEEILDQIIFDIFTATVANW